MVGEFRSGNFKKEDLRVLKTRRACETALQVLLNSKSFDKITVYNICDEALISRAAFYMHFNDKYDLLKFWLNNQREEVSKRFHSQILPEQSLMIRDFIDEHRVFLGNLLKNADDEVYKITSDFTRMLLKDLFLDGQDILEFSASQTTLVDFCVGGTLRLLSEWIKDRFRAEHTTIIPYICDALKTIFEWNAKRRV